MKNFRNIQVEESNLLAWQGLIVPVSCSSSFGCSEIRRPEVPLTNLIGSLSGQPSVWQRCIQDWNHFPHRVPFQASQDHIQDKDLPPQHRWEGPGVLACDQCRELEACHQNWPRLVLKSYRAARCESQRAGQLHIFSVWRDDCRKKKSVSKIKRCPVSVTLTFSKTFCPSVRLRAFSHRAPCDAHGCVIQTQCLICFVFIEQHSCSNRKLTILWLSKTSHRLDGCVFFMSLLLQLLTCLFDAGDTEITATHGLGNIYSLNLKHWVLFQFERNKQKPAEFITKCTWKTRMNSASFHPAPTQFSVFSLRW